MVEREDNTQALSIGAVSRATGIPVDTLRTWERRYGYPRPHRSETGQRIYRNDVVAPLRLMLEAIRRGHRASNVVGASVDALRGLIGDLGASAGPEPQTAEQQGPGLVGSPESTTVETWVSMARALDGEGLTQRFHDEWKLRGGMRFVTERAGPFLASLGEKWSVGEVTVYQEHFASERLREFLASVWRPMSDVSQGPIVVCATLPEERHSLGLHMAAVVASLSGCRVVFLGSDTPVGEIVEAVRQSTAAAVLVSISAASDAEASTRGLVDLCHAFDDTVEVVVGGAGSSRVHAPGAIMLGGLVALRDWCEALVARQRS